MLPYIYSFSLHLMIIIIGLLSAIIILDIQHTCTHELSCVYTVELCIHCNRFFWWVHELSYYSSRFCYAVWWCSQQFVLWGSSSRFWDNELPDNLYNVVTYGKLHPFIPGKYSRNSKLNSLKVLVMLHIKLQMMRQLIHIRWQILVKKIRLISSCSILLKHKEAATARCLSIWVFFVDMY